MSFVPIYQAMQNNSQYYEPGPPPTRGEKIAIAVVAIVATIGLVIFGVYLWNWQQDFYAHQQQMQQDWDAGRGRPAAATVARGQTVEAPATIKQVNEYWDSCTNKSCRHTDLQRYPLVYPVGSLGLQDNCYTDSLSKPVDQLTIAATSGGHYKVALAGDGSSLTICAAAERHDDDKVAIWSKS